jgi:hypothetical protein
LVVSLVVVSGVGTVDAAIGREWDLLVVLVLALALSIALASRLETGRPAIPVRRDLVTWLRERSAVSGETIGALADRALSAYRERYGQAPHNAGSQQ